MAIEWTPHKYGQGADAKLGPGLYLSVCFSITRLPDDEPKFEVSVFGVKLAKRVQEFDSAKVTAETVAQKWLRDALAKLTN